MARVAGATTPSLADDDKAGKVGDDTPRTARTVTAVAAAADPNGASNDAIPAGESVSSPLAGRGGVLGALRALLGHAADAAAKHALEALEKNGCGSRDNRVGRHRLCLAPKPV